MTVIVRIHQVSILIVGYLKIYEFLLPSSNAGYLRMIYREGHEQTKSK